MPLAGTSPRVTANPSKEARAGGMAGPVISPAAIRGGWGTARAGGRRGRGPRTPGSSGWVRRRSPRRTTRHVSPNQGEPLGLEGLVFSAHASHQLINLGDPFSDSGSVPEAAQVPARIIGGTRVRGFSDEQSPNPYLAVSRGPIGVPGRGRRRPPNEAGGREVGPASPASNRSRRPTESDPRWSGA